MLRVGRKRFEGFGGGVVALVEVEAVRPVGDELFDGLVDGRAAHEDAAVGDFGQVDVDEVVAPVDQVTVAPVGRFFAQVSVGRTVHPHHFQLHIARFQVPIFIGALTIQLIDHFPTNHLRSKESSSTNPNPQPPTDILGGLIQNIH